MDRKRGRGIFRETWYSVCSRHRYYDPKCTICQAGHWHNDIIQWCDGIVYDLCPALWRWWHNRPNSKSRRQLAELFPKLKP